MECHLIPLPLLVLTQTKNQYLQALLRKHIFLNNFFNIMFPQNVYFPEILQIGNFTPSTGSKGPLDALLKKQNKLKGRWQRNAAILVLNTYFIYPYSLYTWIYSRLKSAQYGVYTLHRYWTKSAFIRIMHHTAHKHPPSMGIMHMLPSMLHRGSRQQQENNRRWPSHPR
jgi:hypothetical protein